MITLLLLSMTTLFAVVFAAIGFRLYRTGQQQAHQIAILQSQLSALCAGAVGTDERIVRFEQLLGKIKEQQNALDLSTGQLQGYERAIHLARKGVNPNQLIDNCNLSEEEAHLISRMHGAAKQELH